MFDVAQTLSFLTLSYVKVKEQIDKMKRKKKIVMAQFSFVTLSYDSLSFSKVSVLLSPSIRAM